MSDEEDYVSPKSQRRERNRIAREAAQAELCEIVTTRMVHGPCGLDLVSPCMDEVSCMYQYMYLFCLIMCMCCDCALTDVVTDHQVCRMKYPNEATRDEDYPAKICRD